MKKSISLVVFLSIIMLGISFPQNIGPETKQVNENNYSKIIYVSMGKGLDVNAAERGSSKNPYKTISFTLSKIKDAAQSNKYAVKVAEGKYFEDVIKMKEFVDIYGGFDSTNWRRNIFDNETVLGGQNKHRVIIANDNCLIDGFTIRGGVVKDKGGAVLCRGVSPTISNNFFRANKTLKPDNWNPKYRHEIANDGGAIYCVNGSEAIISNNVFYKNKTESGRGAGVALHNKCGGQIIDNLFLENIAGLDDPNRSSDGGAVSVFKRSDPLIENNIILNNKALGTNDAGGIFVALWSSPVIRKNILVGNECTDDAGALFVGGQEHRYIEPLDPLPPKNKFFIIIDNNTFVGNKNPSNNSGVLRLTMESRGIFSNNLCAYNNGIYFQRSEAEIINNTILENFLLIETKQGLKESHVFNNIIWGNLHVDAPSVFSHNDLKEIIKGDGNFSKDPLFKNDNFKVTAFSSAYDPFKFTTTVFVSGQELKKDELAGRIVKVKNGWGIIKSNTENNIEIWGDLSGNIEFNIIPSFKLSKKSPCIDAGMKINNLPDIIEQKSFSGIPDMGAFEYIKD